MSILRWVTSLPSSSVGPEPSWAARCLSGSVASMPVRQVSANHIRRPGRRSPLAAGSSGQGKATHFSQLGIYRLLFAARDLPELRSFHDEALNVLSNTTRAQR